MLHKSRTCTFCSLFSRVARTCLNRFPFTDHTCPPLESVVNFCESAKAWLDMDENNVVSLHCKAGKGRAGIMAACLMVRLGETASDAVSKYDTVRRRTDRQLGWCLNGAQNRAMSDRSCCVDVLKCDAWCQVHGKHTSRSSMLLIGR